MPRILEGFPISNGMTKTQKIIVSGLVVILLLGIYVAVDVKKKTEDNSANSYVSATSTDKSPQATNPVVSNSGNITGDYKIEQVPVTSGSSVPKPIPDLNRPVVSSGSIRVSSDAIVKATEKILKLQSMLKQNPADLAAWIDLGIYQKMAGDYQGTIISWTYATKLNPSNFIAFADLGDFYAYFLKDNLKSEMYYKLAISKAPKQAYLYTQLADVYRYFFKDITKAQAIIEQGLLQVPNDANLLQMKASLQ